MSRRALILALLSTAVLHTWLNRGRDLGHVESWIVMSSAWEHPDLASVLRHAARMDEHPPLHHVLVRLVLDHVSTDLRALRALSLLLFLPGAAALLAFLSRRASPAAAWAAAALLAAGAYPAALSGLIRSYPLLFSLSALYLLRADRTARGEGPGTLGTALLVAALLHTHYVSIFLVAGASAALLFRKAPFRAWLGAHAIGGALFLPWFLAAVLPRLSAPGSQAAYGDIPARESWLEFLRMPFRYFFMGLRERSWILMTALVLLLSALYARAAWKALGKDGARHPLGLLLPAGLATVLLLLLSGALGVLVSGWQYFCILYPVALCAVAVALSELPWRKTAWTAGALLALAGAWTARADHPVGPWTRAADWVRPRLSPGDLLVIPSYQETGEILAYRLLVHHRLGIGIVPLSDPSFPSRHPELPLPPADDAGRARWVSERGRTVWWLHRTGDPKSSPPPPGAFGKPEASPEGGWSLWKFPPDGVE